MLSVLQNLSQSHVIQVFLFFYKYFMRNLTQFMNGFTIQMTLETLYECIANKQLIENIKKFVFTFKLFPNNGIVLGKRESIHIF